MEVNGVGDEGAVEEVKLPPIKAQYEDAVHEDQAQQGAHSFKREKVEDTLQQ